MQKILTIILFLSAALVQAQTAEYGKIKESKKFKEYISKDHQTIKIGDTLLIGLPSNGSQFVYIGQNNQFAGAQLANSKAVITKMRSDGNSKRGFKMFLYFDGWGLLPVYANYETALETGEIKGIINK